MSSHRKTARIVGLLFLLLLITGISGIILRDLSPSLKDVFENSTQIKISILFDLIASTVAVGIAVLLFPILKKFNYNIALWYFGFSIVGFATIVVSNVSVFSLLTLSEEYVKLGSPDTDYFQTLGVLKLGEYFGAHFMGLIIHTFGASMFYYLLFQSKLLPRFLSVWGLIAITLVLSATLLQIFDRSVRMILYLPNGLLQILIGIWLIVKGFNSSAIVSQSKKTELDRI